jgi:Uma2 family endonuclease
MNALPRPDPMTLAQFLAWEARQERKYELVEGRAHLCPGETKRHNLICSNLIGTLGNRLEGKPCQPFGSDTKFLSPTGAARYPDVQVDCARLSSSDMASTEPRVVIEVLSPSNDWLDVNKLLADYQAHPAVQAIVMVSSLKVGAQAWTRDGGAWRAETLETLEGDIPLPSIDAALTMAEIYQGVDFTDPPES